MHSDACLVRHMLVCWLTLQTLAIPLSHKVCLHTTDKALCDSYVCSGYAWCEMCTKCLYAEHAVTKDEL